MALPKLDTPIFELTLPLSKKQISFRPFLVKEQKILLMANEAGDKDTIIRAMKQVLQNCTLNKIEVDTLPLVDVEFYFLNLRARSVGEIVELRYKCENEVEGTMCGNNLDVSFNLLEIELNNTENYTDVIMVNEKIGIKFKQPEFSLISSVDDKSDYSKIVLDIIINSIDYIFEGDSFYYAKETPKEELIEFLDTLSQSQFEKLENYFKNIPTLKKQVETKCSKCGYEHTIQMEGIDNFFG